MSQDWKEPSRKGYKALRKDTDIMFSELEAKFLTIARSAGGQTLPRRAIKEIESLIDDYYKRWEK
jgi:hypothetical protein